MTPEIKMTNQNQLQPVEETKPTFQVLTVSDLRTRIQEETEQRKLITEFISKHMKEGIDYGRIKVRTKDGREVESKPSLFKPGSEKFCSLFHLRPVFVRDDETWEMAGKVPGLFAYKCQLIAPNGAVVGEGRGAARLTEKVGWTENNAIKIAEKRAQIDAVLRTGGLSDFFTQDLEDMTEIIEGEIREAEEKPREVRIEKRPEATQDAPATEAQTRAIFAHIKRLGITEEDLKQRFAIESFSNLTKKEASALLSDLSRLKTW
jgi:hypothetical protein